jgi:hypothetical protein
MIIVLQVAGVLAVLVGLVAIAVGIPVKEFSFGNTLILAGTLGLCTGMILLGLSVVAWELRLVARRLAAAPRPATDPRARTALPPFPAQPGMAAGENGPVFSREPPNAGQVDPPLAPPPLDVEAAASALPQPPKQRRNLMFSSSVRKDREWPPTRPGDPSAPDLRAPPVPAAEPGEVPPASFEDAWPRPDRARSSELPPQRRGSRLAPAESTAGAAAERSAPPPPPPAQPPPTVTVLKSGVVDGMAYSLYSDGSIEAQMPEGMMRFASIDELRAHLEQRP